MNWETVIYGIAMACALAPLVVMMGGFFACFAQVFSQQMPAYIPAKGNENRVVSFESSAWTGEEPPEKD